MSKKAIFLFAIAIAAVVLGIVIYVSKTRLQRSVSTSVPGVQSQSRGSEPVIVIPTTSVQNKQEIIRQLELELLSKFVANEEAATVAPDDYVIYRQGDEIYRHGLRSRQAVKIMSLPTVHESQIRDVIYGNVFAGRIITAGQDIYIDGELYNFPDKAIKMSLDGVTKISPGPCVTPLESVTDEHACSQLRKKRVELEDVHGQPGAETWSRIAFRIKRYESDGTLSLERVVTSSELVRLNNVGPLLITDDGRDVFIASMGDEGGYFGLWRYNMNTEELTSFGHRRHSIYFSGYTLSPEIGKALLYSRPAYYGGAACRREKGASFINYLELDTGDVRRIETDSDFLYGVSISPNGQWYTFSRSDMPPDCRESVKEDLNIKHWLVPLPSNRSNPRAKQMTGSAIFWLNNNLLLLRKVADVVVYNINTSREQLIPSSDPKLEIIGVVSIPGN